MDSIRRQLSDSFGEGLVSGGTLTDGRAAFRIKGVPLPLGCEPTKTDVLVVFPTSGGTPEVYVEQGIKVKGGIAPRNTYHETIDGEPWMRFSTNLAYEPVKPLATYIFGKLGRFSRAE